MSSSEATPTDEPSYYQRHIFFCLNERTNGEDCCAHHNAQAGFDRCKQRVKEARLAGPGGVRVNKAGCLDRCEEGPVAVVYPEGVWYTYVDEQDIEEIVTSHLRDGMPVCDVALRLGFAAHSHFTETFVRYFGTTPSAWVKRD